MARDVEEFLVFEVFTRIPCHLDIALSGRNALRVLKDRNTFKFSFSSINKLKIDICWTKIHDHFNKILFSLYFSHYHCNNKV